MSKRSKRHLGFVVVLFITFVGGYGLSSYKHKDQLDRAQDKIWMCQKVKG